MIYRWRRQQHDNGELAFPGHGKMARPLLFEMVRMPAVKLN